MIAKHLILFNVLGFMFYVCIRKLRHFIQTTRMIRIFVGIVCAKIAEKESNKRARDKRQGTINGHRCESMLNGCAWHLVSFRKCSKLKAINENYYLSFANSILLNHKEFTCFSLAMCGENTLPFV